MYVSPTHSITLHVLNRMPWRYLYIPGLYLFAFGIYTTVVVVKVERAQHYPGWGIFLCNYLPFFLLGPILHSTPAFLMGWYMLKDIDFSNPHETEPTWDDEGKKDERKVRSILQALPWDYAYIPGMVMFVLSFAIIAHAMILRQVGVQAMNWGLAIFLRFYLAFAIALNVAGLALCTGWYLLRGLEVDAVEEGQEEKKTGSGGQDGVVKD